MPIKSTFRPIALTAEAARLLRFAGVGLLATLVHMGGALAAALFGVGDQLSNLIGFCAAFAVSFAGHFFWTFKSEKSLGRTLPRFLVLAVSGYLISAGVLWGLQGVPLSGELRLVFAVCVIPVFSYLAAKYLIF